RAQPLPDDGDGSFTRPIDERERPPLGFRAKRRLDAQSEYAKLLGGTVAELVVAQRGEEDAGVAGQLAHLYRGAGSAAGRNLPGLRCVNDLSSTGNVVDVREFDPFHVAHHGDS